MRKSVKEKLEAMTTEDIYSLMLFTLYALKNEPEYSVESELIYAIDKKNLFNLIELFGGMTIKIPTISDLKLLVNSLLLYQYVNIQGMEFDKALDLIDKTDSQLKDIKEAYFKIVKVLEKYDFVR